MDLLSRSRLHQGGNRDDHSRHQGLLQLGRDASPTLLNWFPTLNTGTYTGQNQGAWTVDGGNGYVIQGGEFTTVNGTAQQGLVRYAQHGVAPDKIGPSTPAKPNVVSLTAGTARVAWQSTFDRDNRDLTYKLVRDGNTANPVSTQLVKSTFWQLPNIVFTDTGWFLGAPIPIGSM